MKKRIAFGCVLLLTLGSAVAGTFLYGQSATDSPPSGLTTQHAPSVEQPTADTIAAWKANALASTYLYPKVPI
jgi:hypothetical protein